MLLNLHVGVLARVAVCKQSRQFLSLAQIVSVCMCVVSVRFAVIFYGSPVKHMVRKEVFAWFEEKGVFKNKQFYLENFSSKTNI